MATNFRIQKNSKSKSRMAFRLFGDFDGTSAYELVHQLEAWSGKASLIEIDTHRLKNVFPFGRSVFEKHVPGLKKSGTQFRILGPKASLLSGDGMFAAPYSFRR